MIPLNGRLETGSQGHGNPFSPVPMVKIAHYTPIAGRVGIGCQSRANFLRLQATVVAPYCAMEMALWLPQAEAAPAEVEGR